MKRYRVNVVWMNGVTSAWFDSLEKAKKWAEPWEKAKKTVTIWEYNENGSRKCEN